MAAGTALAAATRQAMGQAPSGSKLTSAMGGIFKRSSGKGSRIKSLESRVEALEGANSEMEAEAPVAGAVEMEAEAPVAGAVGNATQAAEAAATAQAMSGDATSSMGGVMADTNQNALIPTGRFSEKTQNTANQIFGTQEARQASISQIPAGVAGASQETVGAIADLMNENV